MFAGSRLLLPVSTNFITLAPKPGRKEGHAVREPSLLRGIAVLRRSGSRKKRRLPVAARGGGAGAMEEEVGRKARCRAPGTRRGGCRPRGSGGVGAIRQWAGAYCHPPGWGTRRERGTRCRLPSTGGAIAIRQEAEECQAIKKRNVLQIEKNTCKLRKHIRQFDNAHQARFLPAINRWADRYPGWAIVIGGEGVVVVVDRYFFIIFISYSIFTLWYLLWIDR